MFILSPKVQRGELPRNRHQVTDNAGLSKKSDNPVLILR